MRDLHSADLPIATTEPITSHNECLQVVKSSAIAKHLTEWSDILWKDSHTPGNTTKLRLYRLFKTTYAIEPYLVIVANSQLRKSLCKFRIGCHQLKIETGTWIPTPPVPPPTERFCKPCTVDCVENEVHFLIECQKCTLLREVLYREVITIDTDFTSPEIYILDELRLTQVHTQCFTLHKPS